MHLRRGIYILLMHYPYLFLACVAILLMVTFHAGLQLGRQCPNEAVVPCLYEGNQRRSGSSGKGHPAPWQNKDKVAFAGEEINLLRPNARELGHGDRSGVYESRKQKEDDDMVPSAAALFVLNNLANLTNEKVIEISKGETFKRHRYLQIKETDSPKVGDFICAGTTVPNSCAFNVEDIEEGKRICDLFGNACMGFAVSTILASQEKLQYLIYLKNRIKGLSTNFLTDFYVRAESLVKISWIGTH